CVDPQRANLSTVDPPPAQPAPESTPRFNRRARLQSLLRGWNAFWEEVGCAIANLRRSLRRGKLADYPVILLDHDISERAPMVPWYYAYVPCIKLPLSLEYLHRALQ